MAKDKTEAFTVIDQSELDEIIAKHVAYKGGRSNGTRAILQHYDLSGLSFKNSDMSNADFTSSIMVETSFERCKLDYAVLYACDLRKANFSHASLVRADLRGACLRGAIMAGANLSEADLREGSYATYDPDKGLTFTSDSDVWKEGTGGVDMRGANLGSVKLSGAIAINSNFEDANLSKSTIIRGNLNGANLTGANLAGADLSQCELKNVNLRGANLTGTMMDFSNLDNVDLSGTLTDKPMGLTVGDLKIPLDEMIKSHQIWIKSQGEEGQRIDLSDHDLRNAPSLSGANLTMMVAERAVWYGHDLSNISLQAATLKGGDFRHCTFNNSDLRGTNFSKSTMVGTKFSKSRLEPLFFEGGRMLKTCFAGANLRYSDFTNAVLRDADFSDADLSFANFIGADITGADFSRAVMHDTKIRPLG
ncbi:MAG TPA: pentapeptide repeat-containing protein [Rhodospirillaceae bacterium]|nr:pentapeptide repeat-containing protein [Rhodospirillaceae bacterium]